MTERDELLAAAERVLNEVQGDTERSRFDLDAELLARHVRDSLTETCPTQWRAEDDVDKVWREAVAEVRPGLFQRSNFGRSVVAEACDMILAEAARRLGTAKGE